MDEEEEGTPVTADMIAHTNLHGDVAEDKRHFVEISFDGFRLCETTTEAISLDDFNDKVLELWRRLDEFLVESMERRKTKMSAKSGHLREFQ
jgi:hypothetical protein